MYLHALNFQVNEEYCRHFKTLQPASRSCVAALLPPGVHLLVDCVALSRSAASAAMVSQPTSHAAGAGVECSLLEKNRFFFFLRIYIDILSILV
jgi:hypothetical protein